MLEPRTCANPACGQTYTPARRDARYCNSSCRAQASRLRTGAENQPGPRRAVGLDGMLLPLDAHGRLIGGRRPWPARQYFFVPDGREKRSLTRTVQSPVTA